MTFKLKSSFPFTTALLSWQQTSRLACVKWTLVDRGSWMAKLTVDSIALRFLQPLFMQLGVCLLKSPVKVMEHPATVNKFKK